MLQLCFGRSVTPDAFCSRVKCIFGGRATAQGRNIIGLSSLGVSFLGTPKKEVSVWVSLEKGTLKKHLTQLPSNLRDWHAVSWANAACALSADEKDSVASAAIHKVASATKRHPLLTLGCSNRHGRGPRRSSLVVAAYVKVRFRWSSSKKWYCVSTKAAHKDQCRRFSSKIATFEYESSTGSPLFAAPARNSQL